MKPFAFLLLLPLHAAEPLSYSCRFSEKIPVVDGDLSDPAWEKASWTSDFVDIRGKDHAEPRLRTRVKMLRTADSLVVAAELSEPHVWGTLREKNAVIYQDNDFEIFLDPDGDASDYYEFEVNALGTIWELTLDKPYNKGGRAKLGTNLPGLKCAVRVHGSANDPSDEDKGWTVEVSIPWKDLAPYRKGATASPQAGETWRVNFSRVQWKHEVEDGKYVRVPPHGTKIPWTEHPEDNWVWSPQDEINMHVPEKWGRLVFE